MRSMLESDPMMIRVTSNLRARVRRSWIHTWKISKLDAELRYRPVVDALPVLTGPVCEIGSGPAGLATWTGREVIGVDPGDDARHGVIESPPNFRRIVADGANIPLAARTVSAAVAVDVLEHVSAEKRQAIVSEMIRVTAAGGRVVIMGPVAAASAAADRRLRAKLHSRGIHGGITVWLDEHIENGVPELEELVGYLQDERVARVTARGVFNLRLWWMMHLVSMGALPWFNSLHALAWWPLAAVARRFHCGDCYRTLVVADII